MKLHHLLSILLLGLLSAPLAHAQNFPGEGEDDFGILPGDSSLETTEEEDAEEEKALVDEESIAHLLGPYRVIAWGVVAELEFKDGRLVFRIPEYDDLDLLPPSADEETGEIADPDRWLVRRKPAAWDRGVEAPQLAVRFEVGEEVRAIFERPEGDLELVRDDGLISFDLDVENEGKVRGLAGNFEFQEGEYLLATDGVRLRFGRTEITAASIRVDIPENRLTAEGHVWVEDRNQYLAGESLVLNLEDNTGTLSNAWGRVEPEFFFSGREIAKTGEQTFKIIDGKVTSCTQDVPSWSFALGEATITVNEYARIKNARMLLRDKPVFWVPRIRWPATVERSSGLLIPKPTYSNRRGAGLSMAYFQTLGRSADATFYADFTSESFWAFGTEVRYKPSVDSEGIFEALLQHEPDLALGELYAGEPIPPAGDLPFGIPDEDRWKVRYFHESNKLFGGWRGVIDFEDYSDPVFRLDLERSVRKQTNSFIHSRAYLTRNFGQHSINLLVDQKERIRLPNFMQRTNFPGRPGELVRTGFINDIRKQLPELEYRLRPTKIGSTSIYFGLEGNLHYLSREQLNTTNEMGVVTVNKGEYARADLRPTLTVPLSTLPWLSAKLEVGGRATYYGNSINPETNKFFGFQQANGNGDLLPDETVTRTLGEVELKIVGPSFSRIFEKEKPGRFSKFKHIIEPRIDYIYRDDFKDLVRGTGPDAEIDARDCDNRTTTGDPIIPLFDEVDGIQCRNQATFAVINRLLAKPTDESEGGFEIASFELSMPYSFDNNNPLQFGPTDDLGNIEESQDGPVRALFRFNPTKKTSLKLDARYNTLTSQMRSFSISGGTTIRNQGFGLSLFRNWNNLGEITSDQLRVSTSLKLSDKFSFDAALAFDLESTQEGQNSVDNPLQQRYLFKYNACCYGIQLELRESKFGGDEDRDVLLSISLKNVGSFIDMRGSLN